MINSDHQVVALYLQAFATIAIGILAWTAARGQNIIAEKSARKELFKLRYENIYQEANKLFLSGINLLNDYNLAEKVKGKKKRQTEIKYVKDKFSEISTNFNKTMEVNKFLIKKKDYDKLYSFCENYLDAIRKHIYNMDEEPVSGSLYISSMFNDHYRIIPNILASYLYYENETKFSVYMYKMGKYIKTRWMLFVEDYIPSFMSFIGDILLLVLLFGGTFFAFIEWIKEYLKSPIVIKNGKIKLEHKRTSKYLKRKRPWPF